MTAPLQQRNPSVAVTDFCTRSGFVLQSIGLMNLLKSGVVNL